MFKKDWGDGNGSKGDSDFISDVIKILPPPFAEKVEEEREKRKREKKKRDRKRRDREKEQDRGAFSGTEVEGGISAPSLTPSLSPSLSIPTSLITTMPATIAPTLTPTKVTYGSQKEAFEAERKTDLKTYGSQKEAERAEKIAEAAKSKAEVSRELAAFYGIGSYTPPSEITAPKTVSAETVTKALELPTITPKRQEQLDSAAYQIFVTFRYEYKTDEEALEVYNKRVNELTLHWLAQDGKLIKVGRDDYIGIDEFNKLSKDDQKLLKELGIEAYTKKKYLLLSDGQYVDKKWFGSLSEDLQKTAKVHGLDALMVRLEAQQANYRKLQLVGAIDPNTGEVDTYKLGKALNDGRIDEATVSALLFHDKIISGEMTFAEHYQALEDIKWNAKYQDASGISKYTMGFTKMAVEQPLTLLKELGIGLIPIYSTIRYWKESGAAAKGFMVLSDILFFIPIIGQVSAEIKAGRSIISSFLKSGGTAIRGQLLAPYYILRHPISMVKSLVSPIEVLVSKTRMPIAISWRGSYRANMDMQKIVAGLDETSKAGTAVVGKIKNIPVTVNEVALASRDALSQATNLIAEGKKVKATVPIIIRGEAIGDVHISGTGIQKVLGDVVMSSTPYTPEFTGKGVMAKGEGIFTSTESPLGFAMQSATGKNPLYVYKGKELIGTMKNFELVNDSGYVLGEIKRGEALLDVKNAGKFGEYGNQGIILDADGSPIKNIKLKDGMVWTDDLKLIGKYYKDQPEFVEALGKMGKINIDGMVVDDIGKVLAKAQAKIVAFFPEGTKVTGRGGVVIGRIKAQPGFVMVANQGAKSIYDIPGMQGVTSIEEMEKRAWEFFKSGKGAGELYDEFKQYAKWLENEKLLPPGTAIIPVLDKKGKPVMLWTRSPSGQKIKMPMMQVVTKDWFEKSLALTKDLAGKPTTLKPLSLKSALKQVRNFPQECREEFLSYMRAHPELGIYGGGAEAIYTGNITKDLDLFSPTPKKTTQELFDIFKQTTKSSRQVHMKAGADSGAIGMIKNGVDVKIADIQPLRRVQKSLGYGLQPFQTSIVEGITVQTSQSQIERLFARMTEEFGGKGYAKWARFAKAMGGEVDLGIGAKPPTLKQLTQLKARGIWNVVRDIFAKGLTKETRGLTKETRLAGISQVAPDLGTEANALVKLENRMAEVQRAARAATGRAPRTAVTTLERLQAEYNRASHELKDKLFARAVELDRIIQQVRTSRISEAQYQRLIRQSAYNPDRVRARAERTEVEEVRGRVSRPRTERPRVTVPEVRQPRVPIRTPPVRVPPVRVPPIKPPPIRIRVPPVKPPPVKPPPVRVPPIKPPPIKPIRVKDEVTSAEDERKYPIGTYAWRQGFGYRVLEPPYDQDHFHFVLKPPAGVPIVKGAKSAYKSIVTQKGSVPPQVALDMGIMDIFITTKGKKRPKMKFKRDIKQRTKLGQPTEQMMVGVK